jgi:hypothetical protein
MSGRLKSTRSRRSRSARARCGVCAKQPQGAAVTQHCSGVPQGFSSASQLAVALRHLRKESASTRGEDIMSNKFVALMAAAALARAPHSPPAPLAARHRDHDRQPRRLYARAGQGTGDAQASGHPRADPCVASDLRRIRCRSGGAVVVTVGYPSWAAFADGPRVRRIKTSPPGRPGWTSCPPLPPTASTASCEPGALGPALSSGAL